MGKKENNLALGISDTPIVDEYMQNFQHPLKEVVIYLRQFILGIDKNIGEGIYWNAPTFYYTGNMLVFNPKEYKRYIVGFVFNKKDCIRMVFLHGAKAEDKTGLLEGDYQDGRRLAVFTSIEDVKNKEAALIDIVQQLVKIISNT